jgi:hypothetical protein
MEGRTMTWFLWALALILQNASFTFVSRARNSGSYGLHIIAALCSNGVWFMQFFFTLSKMQGLLTSGTFMQRLGVGAFYTAFTVIGSVLMHWVGKTYIEKGKRKVGA